MTAPRITDKTMALGMLRAGLFGNTLRTWATVADMRADGYAGPVTMRYAVGNTPLCAYRVTQEEIPERIEKWASNGADAGRIQFNESAPDDRLVVQGEVQRIPGGLVLTYSRKRLPMRDALRTAERAKGLEALMILQRDLWPSDLSDVDALLDIYEDSVVEFSAYEVPVGCIPNRNTVIWEVRNY